MLCRCWPLLHSLDLKECVEVNQRPEALGHDHQLIDIGPHYNVNS